VTSSSEHERIAALAALFGDRVAPGVTLAIGDDAAVIAPVGDPLVWSIDAAVEGTHFRRDLMTLADAGWRATMAALSDLAAMGAAPVGVLSALALPQSLTDEELYAIAAGQRDAAAACGTSVIGGNLARADVVSITTSVIGRAAHPLTRAGASPGDQVWLLGDPGWASAGMRVIEASLTGQGVERASHAFRRPSARIAGGLAAARSGATACIDVSDGLGADLGHLARSSGVAITIDEAALADEDLAGVARSLGVSWAALAIGGGEDYALVATAPAGVTIPGFRLIGACSAGSGVSVRDRIGGVRALDAAGWDHFVTRR
jgi:thiamine-monophosphate kinase